MKISLRVSGLAVAALLLGVAVRPAVAGPQRFEPEALQADLKFAMAAIERIHPDLDQAVDHERLEQTVGDTLRALDHPMTRDEAWSVMARLNPVFADGHLLIGFDDWRQDGAAHLKTGGYFPFEVALDERGDLRIVSLLGGGASRLAGARIVRINGQDVRLVVEELLARTHGDTPAFRAALLARRWWFFYWKLHGSPETYDIVVASGTPRTVRMAASRAEPVVLQDDASFEKQFGLTLLPNHAALLTVSSFAWPDEARYLAFTRDAFAELRDARVRTLIIDLRANGGGSDSPWMEGLLRYIADRPYRSGSRYTKRVLAGHQDEGQTIGDIVTGEITTWIAPDTGNPLHFSGRVYVLVGPSTYSSAILFSNVVQDYGFGAIAGSGAAVRARQTGGVQRIVLPNTGLVVSCPRFRITRPSGAADPEFLKPDTPLVENPRDPRATVDALVTQSGNGARLATPAGSGSGR